MYLTFKPFIRLFLIDAMYSHHLNTKNLKTRHVLTHALVLMEFLILCTRSYRELLGHTSDNYWGLNNRLAKVCYSDVSAI